MAIGDKADMWGRLRGMLPRGWFGSNADPTNILAAVLKGIAACLSFLYSLYTYAQLQSRIATATDGWLDIISNDFFGTALPRKPGESDASFRSRILANLTREKATRNGISMALYALTGYYPIIVEPWRPLDTGAYGHGASPFAPGATPGYGYNTVGSYGSLSYPAQAFITTYRPTAVGNFANVAGYGISVGAYNTGSQSTYGSMSLWTGGLTDDDIYACVAATKAEGTIMWVSIQNPPSH